MSRRIVITSGKGGVGKTTLCACLGAALSSSAAVVLIDADLGLNNLDVALGVENKVVYDIGDVADGKCRLKQALVSAGDNLFLLPSAKINGDRIKTQEFSSIVAELAINYDYVIIDCPAGIDSGFHRAVSAAREAVVVTTPHISAVRDADKVLSLLSTYDLDRVSLAVNRVRGDMAAKGAMMGARDIAGLLRVQLIASLPEDDSISVNGTADINARDRTQKAYKMFAEFIKNGTGEVFDCEKGYRGFFYKLINGSK